MKITKVSKKSMETLLLEKLEAFYGKADPETVKRLSDILDRELVDRKDTEDYNIDLVSELIDRHVKIMMEAGQSDFKAGDVLKIDSKEAGNLDKNIFAEELEKALVEERYELYPFNHALEREMRAYFLLRTEKKDTYKDLMHEFESLAPNFMTTAELIILKRAIKKAEGRIFKEELEFLNPPEGQEQGELREVQEFEKKALGMTGKIMIDKRKDNHDLLALKEMVLMMRGDDVHPLSIGPGFFSKYMPELLEEGFLGVITEVRDNKLSKIYLAKLPGEDLFSGKGYEQIRTILREFSPALASSMIFYNLQSKFVKGTQKVGNKESEYGFHEVNESFFDGNVRYYVTVDGMISGPSSRGPLSYEEASKNDKRIPAAETFLIQKENGAVLNTRIYFSAYKPKDLHPVLQHGSVVYGLNDMSFHSCQRTKTPEGDIIVLEEYKEFMKSRHDQGKDYVPADVAGQLNYYPKRKDGKNSVTTDMFFEENEAALIEIADGVIENNYAFLTHFVLKWISICNPTYISGNALYCLKEMLDNAQPLNHRWLVSKYVKDQKGITKEPSRTFYRRLVEDIEKDNLKNVLELNAELIRKKSK